MQSGALGKVLTVVGGRPIEPIRDQLSKLWGVVCVCVWWQLCASQQQVPIMTHSRGCWRRDDDNGNNEEKDKNKIGTIHEPF